MLFHLILNSFFVFCILALLIECTLRIFNIKNGRIRTFCRALPFLKIPCDLFVFGFYGDSLLANFNPFSCDIFLTNLASSLFSSHFQTELSPGQHVIIPQYIAMFIPSHWLHFFLVITIIISIVMSLKKFFQFIASKLYLKNILRSSSPCTRPISNEQLRNNIQKLQALILTSTEITIPFAANKQFILFPENLVAELSQEEFEAIVAHELEHLLWKDPLLKVYCAGICALLWWIPTGWWLRRLEDEQERASDASIHRYGMDHLVLGAAIIKVIHRVKGLKYELPIACHFASSKNNNLKRFKDILEAHPASQKYDRSRCIVGTAFCLLTFICFWMC